jgi:hypothetical protein
MNIKIYALYRMNISSKKLKTPRNQQIGASRVKNFHDGFKDHVIKG